ncbi:ABC transporter permease [Actinomadura barringtoniae]|uniref:ABC transporter permease n=1 Tax=Actinomadura barringtoniae TaxID=1427535 RepID=A0A939TA74_9ACTN|nr:ABC transporter permease [Actinomadura barringtoniae]MBO2455843.1 ABC transporter permease [Actinomadura barringtoniae]
MIGLAAKELWGHRRRLAGSLIAVFLGVAFLAGTLVLGDTMSKGIDRYFANAYADTDVSVRNATQVTNSPGQLRGQIDGSVLDTVAGVPGVAHAEPVIQGSGQLLGKDGKNLAARGPRVAGNWITDPKLNAYHLVNGRAPSAPDEIVITELAAEQGKLRVGDRTSVLTPQRVPVTVVGISRFGDEDAFGETTFTAFSADGARRHVAQGSGRITGVAVRADGGVSQEALAARVRGVLPAGTEAITGAKLTKEGVDQVSDGFLRAFRIGLAAFGVVALLVAAFSIHNTFAITLAQRTRESALLRALGASRGQLGALAVGEAVVVGVIATLAGLAGGLGMAALLKLVFAGFGMGLDEQGLVFTATPVLIALPTGLLVTLLATLSPAVRASRVAPLAALREVAAERQGPSESRIIIGAVLAAVSVGGVVWGALTGSMQITGAGALMTLAVMIVLGPIAARPAAAIAGAPAARLRGVAGALARDNAARSPRRTAGAAAALMIGVGVVTLMTVFAGSLKASVEDGVAGSFHGSLVVNGGTNDSGGFSPAVADQVARLPQVAAAAGLGRGDAKVGEDKVTVRIADPARLGQVLALDVRSGSLAGVGGGAGGGAGLAVSKKVADDNHWRVGTAVPVTFADGTRQPFTIGAIYRKGDVAGDYVLPRTAWAEHTKQPLDLAVFADLKPGASAADARRATEAIVKPYGAPDVQDRDGYVAAQTEQMSAFLGIVYAMLALAIIIALLGIANTLSLSVHERTRELGLLRAVGATRSQVRSMVRWESVIVAVFGTAGGLGLGLFLGWALTRALGNPFAAPVVPMTVVALVGAVAGVLAAIRPARRAARLAALTAIATP